MILMAIGKGWQKQGSGVVGWLETGGGLVEAAQPEKCISGGGEGR